MIAAPILLSFIYEKNKELTFYISAIISSISLFVIFYVATWKNSKDIGKKAIYENETAKKEVELKEIQLGENESEKTV